MSAAAAAAPWMCYLLACDTSSATYIGVTPDLDRRLAQHNGLQSGGAKATSGRSWHRVCYVRGFPDQRAALQFEWAWKHRSKRYTGPALVRRFRALQELLADSRSTSLATPFEEYPAPLEVIMERPEEVPIL